MTTGAEYLSTYLLTICNISFGEIPIKSFNPFLFLFGVSFQEYFYIQDIKCLLDTTCKYLLPFLGCLFFTFL